MRANEGLRFEVDNPVGKGSVCIAGASYVPDDQECRAVLVCIPGGSYSRKYWHSPDLAAKGYSFAEFVTERGCAVVALDTLGTGGSSRVDNGDDLTLETLAQASADAVAQIRSDLAAVCGAGVAAEADVVGVGHSLGGAIGLVQQGAHESFDALAVLGFTNLHLETMYVPHEREGELTPQERMQWARQHVPERSWGKRWNELDMYFYLPRENLRSWFHWADVPQEIQALEEAEATVIPRSVALQSIVPGCTAPYAAKISSPVFLAFGEMDVSPDPRAEPGTYPQSGYVSLFLLPRSGHCHNYSGTRTALWGALAGWSTASK
jgi:pimeloyl-ACP methyl ester carboxylesterase